MLQGPQANADWPYVKLHTLERSPREDAARLRDLRVLLCQPLAHEARVCPGCTVPCACSGSRTCTCGCSPRCAQAPKQLSSEGERYPVEPKVVPLVFALQELRVCPPCWSCEGHARDDGQVFRVPQVWFYTRSLIYVRLLAEWLRTLRHRGRIAGGWRITASYSESGLDTAFSLEPDAACASHADLAALQHDVRTMASAVVHDVRLSALEYLGRYAPPRARTARTAQRPSKADAIEVPARARRRHR